MKSRRSRFHEQRQKIGARLILVLIFICIISYGIANLVMAIR